MSGLFISYRRQDSAAAAGRLRSDLARRYGDARVVLDVVDIAPGANWSDQLHKTIAACESMLVVIGPGWLSATDPAGRRRVDDPTDSVRSEVAAALRMGKPVVPVLVGGARMPSPGDLPAELTALARRQAGELRDEHWRGDLERFFDVLDPLMGPAPAVSSSPSAAPRAMPSLMSRLALAFQVLLGRTARDRAVPPPAHPRAVDEARTPTAAASTGSLETPPPAPRRIDVFVSYSADDRDLVEAIVGALESRGRSCWYAQRDIPPGVPSWAEPIVTAIANSRLVLVVLTRHSMPSMEVLREVTVAADEKIPLLPVDLDGTPLSGGLKYFFVAGQRLELRGIAPHEQVARILPAVDRNLPVRT